MCMCDGNKQEKGFLFYPQMLREPKAAGLKHPSKAGGDVVEEGGAETASAKRTRGVPQYPHVACRREMQQGFSCLAQEPMDRSCRSLRVPDPYLQLLQHAMGCAGFARLGRAHLFGLPAALRCQLQKQS